MSTINEILADYPDANEFIGEALGKDYQESKDRQANSSAILDAVIAGDDAEAGRIISELCRNYAAELAGKE